MNIEEILHANLTDEQYSAVIDDSRNILCLACAGSGKSRTLAYKIAYLISRGEAPESIIAFTFTEKAAESIKRRVAEALHKFGLSENIVGAMFIGTLDAFCQKLWEILMRNTASLISWIRTDWYYMSCRDLENWDCRMGKDILNVSKILLMRGRPCIMKI